MYFLKGDHTLGKAYADSAVAFIKEKVKQTPDEDRYYAALGKSYALSGNEEEAIKCGKMAVDLKPVTLDVYQGTARREDLMNINILTGMYDLAFDEMEYLLNNPSWLSRGELLIDPFYDRMRYLQRFQEIISSEDA